ncbi:hypothetical protein D554_2776 [Bordetella holmesii 30539]|uniref:Uncharacterized protein n=2 Tax=Bordetella holmesii TaxID=35814 RepID=A0A158LZM9_9BORD|nr:hypothetical protein D560_2848 [Bordetella holmesii ATCC 51541]AIT27482.1 hypothetical protein D558_2826 [Bordetella holmesii 44057]EWM42282.1 hypothetical protein D556_2825 [Bordetella holmesii 41130]EWM48073.1 hypothetical protein D555_2869 [Bordetella holmesii 35009]EWM49056.1 hypothetical protein D557_2124 [Bordetella holmesii 70147]EXF87516.1 hypothetical protein D554_2776 [Bordetella holmesii 30539]EXX93519.1 hypothetical protein D559_0911 [Bordetella holmesii 1058]KAK77297.1 hypoth
MTVRGQTAIRGISHRTRTDLDFSQCSAHWGCDKMTQAERRQAGMCGLQAYQQGLMAGIAASRGCDNMTQPKFASWCGSATRSWNRAPDRAFS